MEKAVRDVTWDVVAELNAKHAQEQAEVTKAAALELLRRNSCERPPPGIGDGRHSVASRNILATARF